jgi:hypothetical protein
MHGEVSMIIPVLNNKLRQQIIPRAFARNKPNKISVNHQGEIHQKLKIDKKQWM